MEVARDAELKRCTKCGHEKAPTAENFNRHGSGLRPECRDCQSAAGKAYSAANREKINARAAEYRAKNREILATKSREYHGRNRESCLAKMRAGTLKHEYGLAPEQYLDIFDAQGGVCQICKRPPGTKSLRVDHDHISGKVRGLLCAACNTAIGILGDDSPGLFRAVEYLESADSRVARALPNGPAFEPRSRRYK